ncbi:MAG: phage major capsid protein [Pseudolabrys sp.]|nr:phage major capsid protein [Pseudolabrys sp.]
MTPIRKTVAGGDGLEFVLSDETVDRMGDIVTADGWVLTNFRQNPIALFGHNSSFPIGKWTNIRIEGGKLIAKLKLASRGTSARIDELISLVEQGVLRAVSVGFIPIKAEPIDEKRPYDGTRFLKQELLETSLVSVPANPAALQLAKSLNISDETLSLAFGEHADVRRKDVTASGEHADMMNAAEKEARAALLARPKVKTMKTLSQRIVDAQTSLNAKKDKLAELTGSDAPDVEAIKELNTQIDGEAELLEALTESEKKIGVNATKSVGVTAPTINRRPLGFPQRELGGLDLLVRRAVVHACALYSEKSIEQVLEQKYPGHEATALYVKAAAPLGTTSDAGFAAELVQVTYTGFLDALRGKSIYPALRERGFGVSFDAAGTAYIPQLTAGGANGSFFAEGSPIRVGRITTASPTFTSRKMGVIIPFSREAAKRSTPSLEGIVRRAIIDDTAAILDSHLLDATAGDTVRPAGLLNGVSAIATGYGGGDHLAVKEDFKALLAPFIDANAADGITVIMNPKQGLSLAMMDGPANNAAWFSEIAKRVNILESTHATAGRLVAVRNSDFATATGDVPEFEVSTQATIHMEDTTPVAIGTAGSPNVVAAPTRSFFQTDSMGVRMVMDVSWKMGRTGMVQWINGTTW